MTIAILRLVLTNTATTLVGQTHDRTGPAESFRSQVTAKVGLSSLIFKNCTGAKVGEELSQGYVSNTWVGISMSQAVGLFLAQFYNRGNEAEGTLN